MREGGRKFDELRPVNIVPHYLKYAEGSALIELGDTRIICGASLEAGVPSFLKNSGQGWITAEYGMLPRSTGVRMFREATRGRVSGRTQEIQRIIGRSLRAMVDLNELGALTIWIDCDVIQADGGTRTASVTGGFVALVLALQKLYDEGLVPSIPVRDYVAAVSVGIVAGEMLLDLTYEEDSVAEVDMNVAQTGRGKLVEIQGTSEAGLFSLTQLRQMATLARQGIKELIAAQREVLGPLLER